MSSLDEALQAALDQLLSHGLQVESIDTSGRLVRVPVEGDKCRKKSGWYVAHEFNLMSGKTVIVGRFGNWKLSVDAQHFEADYKLSRADQEALRKKQDEDRKRIDAERKRAAAGAAKRAEKIWSSARDTGNSEYLKNKGVRGFYIGYLLDHIIVPVRTITGQLVGLQFIYNDGSKKFLTGTPKRGAFHLIGDAQKSGQVIIAEGYATAASIYEASNIPCAIAFDAGNLLPVAQAFRKRYPNIKIIVAADDDHQTENNPGITKGRQAAQSIGGWLVSPVFEDKSGRTDFNDMDQEQGLKAVRECITRQIDESSQYEMPRQEAAREQGGQPPGGSSGDGGDDEPPDRDEWQQYIQRNEKGKIIANLANTYLFLTNMECWQGVIAYDEFASRVVCTKAPPYGGEGDRNWTDNDDTRTATWFSMYAHFSPKLSDVQKVVEIVAEDNKFHKVREYLADITWDGQRRVGRWLIDYLGALPDADENASQVDYATHEDLENYLVAAGTKWLIGAIARVMRPGCKMDNVLILEGDQGEGKSSALKILAREEWFNETMIDLNDKDAKQMLCGKWIIELAELDSFNKADSTKAKGFFSTSIDTYRQSYGRRMQDIPRQCVFAGTTNQHEYLRDDANRRYWPIYCHAIDRKALLADRDQLWAEALHLYESGIKWWPIEEDKHLFEIEQQKRRVEDPWIEPISDWLDQPERRGGGMVEIEVTINQVLIDCLGFDNARIDERMQRMRVGKIMKQLGWVKHQRSNSKDRYYYKRGRDAG